MRRPPAALALLLAATAILGFAWAVLVPAFQAPDENAHFAYVQRLAEAGELPGNRLGVPYQSSAQNRAADVVNADQTATQLDTRPEWSGAAERRWREEAASLPPSAERDGEGASPVSVYPPLYYLYGTAAYAAASSSDMFGRLVAVRLASVLCLLASVLATWLLAGELFGRNRLLQLAAASVPALLPMFVFISSSVTPDSLMYALWSFALWLAVRVVGRGLHLPTVAALTVVTGLAIVTKATSVALLAPVALALAIAAWRARRRLPRVAVAAVVAVLGIAVTAGAWYVAAQRLDRPVAAQISGATAPIDISPSGFARYVFRFYVPHPGADSRGYDVWFKQAWGAFGWLEVRWPAWVYVVALVATLAVVALALFGAVRRRVRPSLPVLAVLAVAAAGLIVGLHWAEYRSILSGAGPINQGRYLFPLAGLAGAIAACALAAIPRRAQPAALAAGVAALLVLHVFALAIVATRFYA